MSKLYKAKPRWEESEKQQFLRLMAKFDKNFNAYVPHINKSVSQIKSHYYNLKKVEQAASKMTTSTSTLTQVNTVCLDVTKKQLVEMSLLEQSSFW